ncbi:MAG: phosphatase PAP2 family protein [Bacteroidota bacterium]
MEQLIQWDIALFEVINQANVPWLDEFMFLISEKWFWIPAYLVVLFLLKKQYSWKKIGGILIAVALLILCTDQITSSLLKPTVKRFRPCQVEAQLDFEVHQVHDKCGGKYGFASSHAANFFGLATFLSLLFKRRGNSLIFLGAAILVAYSRIYLGVHYPLDVLVGGLLGGFFGWGIFFLYSRVILTFNSSGQ